jgi:hypothetical protein
MQLKQIYLYRENIRIRRGCEMKQKNNTNGNERIKREKEKRNKEGRKKSKEMMDENSKFKKYSFIHPTIQLSINLNSQ